MMMNEDVKCDFTKVWWVGNMHTQIVPSIPIPNSIP